MHFRKLGRTGIDISEIGYGAWGIGQKQWIGASDTQSLEAMNRAVALGLNFIDTALAYGDGHSEELVGRVVREHPHVHVATKVPPKNRLWPARSGTSIEDVFPFQYVMECTEASLRNLRVESIALQQFHVWNPEWLASDEWRRAIEELKKSGKARAVGISINDHQPDSALQIVETGLIDTVQVIYNIFDQSAEAHLFPLCQKLNIGVIVRVPFDEGALTGNITKDTKFPPGDFRELYFKDDRKAQVDEHVQSILHDLKIPRQALPPTAMRFCLSHPAVSTVIPGMRSVTSVESNCSTAGLGPLPDSALAVLKRHAWDRNFYPA
jgi:aryl-alcohol dehydrogenase-like predicted oxidoreductase